MELQKNLLEIFRETIEEYLNKKVIMNALSQYARAIGEAVIGYGNMKIKSKK